MILSIVGVYQNGTVNVPPAAAAPYMQPLVLPVGSGGRLNLSVVDPAGAAVNIAAMTFIWTGRNRYTDAGVPPISRQSTLISAPLGTAYFPIAAADTVSSGLYVGPCGYDIWADVAGVRSQIVPWSMLYVAPALGYAGAAVTVPASQSPLSSAAAFVTQAQRDAMAPASYPGVFIYVTDLDRLQVSDGNEWRTIALEAP